MILMGTLKRDVDPSDNEGIEQVYYLSLTFGKGPLLFVCRIVAENQINSNRMERVPAPAADFSKN